MINYETNESYPLLRDCFEKLIRMQVKKEQLQTIRVPGTNYRPFLAVK